MSKCPAVSHLARASGIIAAALSLIGLVGVPTAALSYTPVTENCQEGDGAGSRWRGGPTRWVLNERGSTSLSFEETLAALKGAFEVWEEPCCSGFTSQYDGTTKRKFQLPLVENVIAFEQSTWPQEAGSSRGVVASTLRAYNRICGIDGAMMIFNEIDFSFSADGEGTGGNVADLRWIAAHEVGHWLGLLHSEDPGAIMRVSYRPDLPYEGLYDDDVAGVCALYPGSCDSCERNADCPEGSACKEARCVASECRGLVDCALGTICQDELCVPGCRSHSECGQGQGCLEGSCVDQGAACEKHVDCASGESCVLGVCQPQPETCTVCEACESDNDCGLYNFCMTTSPTATVGFCSNPCQTDRDCAGNSICQYPPGSPSGLCVLPSNSTQGPCVSASRCEIDEPGPELGCALLGEACTGGSFGCGGRADTCIDTEDGAQCSCTCREDDECGPGARCLLDPSTGLDSCFPESLLVACEGSFCDFGEQCVEGVCAVDPCAGVSCGAAEECVEGSCVAAPGSDKPKSKAKAGSSSCASAGAMAGAGGLPLLLALSLLGRLRRRGR